MKNKKIINIATGLLMLTLMFGSFGIANAKSNNGEKNENSKSFRNAKDVGSTLEVHFYENGKVLVRGALVTGVSGSTINATTTWGSVSIPWAINTSGAEFVNKRGNKLSVSETVIGDFVSFNGTLQTTTASPYTVNATIVKNWSKDSTVNQKTTLEGKIKSIPSIAIPGTMVVTVGNQDYTVRVLADTSILNLIWLKTSFSNYKAGDKIRVYGTVNADFTVDATVVRNISI